MISFATIFNPVYYSQMEEIRKEKMYPRKIHFGFPAVFTTVFLLWAALPGGGEYFPLLFVACVPLFVCVCRGNRRQALLLGLSAGLCFFLIELYWIIFVLGQYGGLPLYLSLPALFLLSLYMAGYMMAFAWLANVFVNRFSAFSCLWLFPAAWVGLDWLRSFAGSGLPWMDLGYGFVLQPFLLQSADIWGHYGLTFLVIDQGQILGLGTLAELRKQAALPSESGLEEVFLAIT